MANLMELCRLCAKKNNFAKDLLDDSNKSILDLIKQFLKIAVDETDHLPKKICLDCEEKMVSFQLFILECYEVQESFNKMFSEGCVIKNEDTVCDMSPPLIKSEVKDELPVEEDQLTALCVINDEDDPKLIDYNTSFHDDDDTEDEELDNLTIASLKEMKSKFTNKKSTEEEIAEFKEILKKPNLKMKDVVRLECTICEKPFNSWTVLNMHSVTTHKIKPIIYCKCGFLIKSKSVLYKHVTEHKRENRRIRSKYEHTDPESNSLLQKNRVRDYIDFRCRTCEKRCSSWYSLRSHCQRFHKLAPVVQCTCGLTIKSKSVMYKHVADHKNPSDLSCDKCSLVTKSVAALNKHKLKHVPKTDRQFCCSSCDKIFNSKDALKSHERSHIPVAERKVFHCEVCDMKFTTRSAATSHKRVVHDKIKSYVCDLCGYACGTNGELRQHRAIHSDDKPFVCKTCSKSFKTYSNLKTHMDTHAETSYECYICNRVLNSRRTLRKHLLVHEDKCRHVCSYCNKGFKRRQTLKVHMYTHTGDKPLSCKWCEERFAYASTLRSHRLRCHPDKMAAHSQHAYNNYSQIAVTVQENYIKNNMSAVNISKNDVDNII